MAARQSAADPAPPSAHALPRLPLGPQASDLQPAERRWLIAGVAGAHLLLAWGLLQVAPVQQALREVAPLMVDFIAPPLPDKPQPPPPPPPPQAKRPPVPSKAPPPPVIAAPAVQQPAPSSFTVPAPVPTPPAQAAVVADAPPAPPAPPAPAAPPLPAPAPKAVAASALRYAVLPPIELPLASRRLGESGTVLVRVVFDTAGRPRQVALHKSSGFARLDEQALAAMRQARITPHLDNGQPVEVSAIAPLAYDLE